MLIGAPFANILREDTVKRGSIRLDIDSRTVANVVFPLAKEPPAISLAQNPVTMTHVEAKLADIQVLVGIVKLAVTLFDEVTALRVVICDSHLHRISQVAAFFDFSNVTVSGCIFEHMYNIL